MSIIFLKNWRLNLLGILLSSLFLCLSYWQYQRAQEKEQLQTIFSARKIAKPLTNQAIEKNSALPFYRATLTGTFDNTHTILLDNRTYQGKIGYEIYTPFRLQNSQLVILVDRGFIGLKGANRSIKPDITLATNTTITGLLNTPPRYYSKGKMVTDTVLHPFIRIEYIDLTQLSSLLGHPLSPVILQLSPKDPEAYPITWQESVMPKEKHLAYSLQWFALSLTLLVLLVALNKRKNK